MVEELFKSKDHIIRAVRLRTPKLHIEQPIQYLHPLELHCDMESTSNSKKSSHKKLNLYAKEYRPRRTAAAITEMRARAIVAE